MKDRKSSYSRPFALFTCFAQYHCATQKKIQNSKEGFLDNSGALITNMNSVFSHHPPFFCNFGFKFSQKYTFLPYGAYYIVAFESFFSRYFVVILSVSVEVLAAGEVQCL